LISLLIITYIVNKNKVTTNGVINFKSNVFLKSLLCFALDIPPGLKSFAFLFEFKTLSISFKLKLFSLLSKSTGVFKVFLSLLGEYKLSSFSLVKIFFYNINTISTSGG